jgi:hypothetical protein
LNPRCDIGADLHVICTTYVTLSTSPPDAQPSGYADEPG